MKKEIIIIFIVGLFIFLSSCKAQNKKEEEPLPPEKFKAGQVWKYVNRDGEDSSTLTVLKIEKYDKGDTIIHIRVDGIKIYNSQTTSGYSNFIAHLPISEKAIKKSVTRLIRTTNSLPAFTEGYNQWKEAWDKGKGGYWTLGLKEVIENIDKAMQPNK